MKKRMLLRNDKGIYSSSLTIAWISFLFCLIAIGLGLLEELTVGGTMTIKFRMLDAGVIFALLGPAFGLYGWRRYTDSNNGIEPAPDVLQK